MPTHAFGDGEGLLATVLRLAGLSRPFADRLTARLVVFDLDGTLIDGYAAIEDALVVCDGSDGHCRPWGPGRSDPWSATAWRSCSSRPSGPRRAEEGVRLYRERYPSVCIEKSRAAARGAPKSSRPSATADTRSRSPRTSPPVSPASFSTRRESDTISGQSGARTRARPPSRIRRCFFG